MFSKHLIIPLFVSVFSMAMITAYYKLLPFFLNFYIARRLRVFWSLYNKSKVILTQEKVVPKHLLEEFIVYILTICGACVCYFLSGFVLVDKYYLDLVQGNSQTFLITLLIWIGIFYLKKLTESEISYLTSVNNLTLGYGVAIWYYKNYLDRILPDNFLMRVRQFESKEGVQLPHKLYILCPESCKVEKYIDRTENIEFSKDLPPYEIDHGGIARRKYNISVYRIKYNGQFFRCALEYAQPLKTLLAFKEKGRISLSKMGIQRKLFIENLTLLLKDHKNSFDACEVVEYDDKTQKLHEILSALPSVQAFKCQTPE